jgi:aspartyl aminopeptidase
MTNTTSQFNQGLIDFLNASPTPFHAVASMQQQLELAGFKRLEESQAWGVLAAGRYFVTRNDSSIIAFTLADKPLSETGIRMVGAHTDSPCLRVKPKPELTRHSLFQLGVEVYGGALLNPWFDRDLSMAGRVSVSDSRQNIHQFLVDFKQAIATIPSLAIHLDREANQNHSVNPQLHLPPIVMQVDEGDSIDFRALLEQQLRQDYPEADIQQVLDYEISLYDTQSAAVVGLNQDFINSARLDNLLSCYIGLQAIKSANTQQPSLLVCTDHEEVGSVSAAGASGNFLESVLQRLTQNAEDYSRLMQQSMMISVDNAHAIHPNYADKHDAAHGPLLNKGPVIKTNANQRYASNSKTSAVFRQLCAKQDVPVQDFVVRSDMACGSTIGPLTACQIGVDTIDVGVPTFGMHSIRETAGSQDASLLLSVLKQFYNPN